MKNNKGLNMKKTIMILTLLLTSMNAFDTVKANSTIMYHKGHTYGYGFSPYKHRTDCSGIIAHFVEEGLHLKKKSLPRVARWQFDYFKKIKVITTNKWLLKQYEKDVSKIPKNSIVYFRKGNKVHHVALKTWANTKMFQAKCKNTKIKYYEMQKYVNDKKIHIAGVVPYLLLTKNKMKKIDKAYNAYLKNYKKFAKKQTLPKKYLNM